MFDFFCIFTTGGMVLWAKAMVDSLPRFDLINILIRDVIVQEKTNQDFYTYKDYTIKWIYAQRLGLVFAVVYKTVLQISRVDDLLSLIQGDFMKKVMPKLS